MKKIEVQGLAIRIKPFHEKDYISLTDIAAKAEGDSKQLILRWMQNADTLLFLQAWEELHNPDFKVMQMNNFRLKHLEKRYSATPQKYIEQTNAIGIVSKSGRYGGTYAHKEIALN
ncbi:MAG: KilA-N domain-containing protein, partial [Bacteroidota bacterium]